MNMKTLLISALFLISASAFADASDIDCTKPRLVACDEYAAYISGSASKTSETYIGLYTMCMRDDGPYSYHVNCEINHR